MDIDYYATESTKEKPVKPVKKRLFMLQVTSPAKGKLVGIMLPPFSTVQSYGVVAWVDVGDENWDKSLLPVAEWPDAG
jgi:hypothetical protein